MVLVRMVKDREELAEIQWPEDRLTYSTNYAIFSLAGRS